MSRKTNDLSQTIVEIKEILERYSGIPKQSLDRAAHAKIKYFLKTYKDEPQIQELITQYNLKEGKEKQISEVTQILKEFGRIPSVKENTAVYGKVRYLFQKHSDLFEVIKLKYIYAHQSCYPLPDSKFGPRPESTPLDFYVGNVPQEFIEWKDNVTYEYIEYVYENFQSLPGPETKPMINLRKNIKHWYRYNVDCGKKFRTRLFDFLQRMVNIGCKEQFINEAYYSFFFDDIKVQEKVREIVIENGACAIHYIAQVAISNCPLDDYFVYYYYYVILNDVSGIRNHMPVGELYSGNSPHRVLRVHYRDYHKCDVSKIRESAMSHYRNWKDSMPETLEEWKYYGQSEFFDNKEDMFYAHILGEYNWSIDWSTTYIEKQMTKGCPYFRHFGDSLRYLDYYLFLLENGHTLKDEKLLKSLDLERLKDMDLNEQDKVTLNRILEYISIV